MLVAFGTKVKLNNYPFPQKTSFIQHEELQSWTTSISIKPSGDSGKALVASWLLHTLPRHNRFGIVHTRQDILHVGGNHIHSVPNLHSCHRDFETYSARSALQETFEVLSLANHFIVISWIRNFVSWRAHDRRSPLAVGNLYNWILHCQRPTRASSFSVPGAISFHGNGWIVGTLLIHYLDLGSNF